MAKRVQVLISVDLDAPIVIEELTELIPHERDERHIFILTDYGAPRLERHGPNAVAIPWDRIGPAVEAVVQQARLVSTECLLDLYIGGQGPLPVFTHLGYAFSKFTGAQTVIGRQYGGVWQALPISTSTGTAESIHLSHRVGFRSDAAATTGRVAVYLDTAGRPPPVDAVRELFARRGESLAEVVELRSADGLTLSPDNVASVAQEIARELPRIPAMYPHSEGSSFFIAGPTALGFMVGRALNPTLERGVVLTNHGPNGYEFVYELPFVDRARREPSKEPEDIGAREKVRATIVSAVESLQTEIQDDDIPESLSPEGRKKFTERLRELKHDEKTSGEFDLSIATGTYSLGDGLLEALRDADVDKQGDFAKLLLLHELFHDLQGVRSTNYLDIGRAGVVLEHLDFAADVFAVRVALAADLRVAGSTANENAKTIAKRWMETVLFGIERFDLYQHGPRIIHLAERRLRRYLTWHLQLARAETVTCLDDARALLATALAAELAPLASRVDARYDKEVLDALPMTEFFAAVDARLIRAVHHAGFDPGALVEAVRSFNRPVLSKAAHFLIEEFRPILVPWRS